MSYMERALSLARRALGSVSPNPAVGAVIVRNGKIVGEGYTQPPGQQHAEAVALQQAGELARGATLYTTLEPCNHIGRTPACAQAIINAGITVVHMATLDPNPHVKGGGLANLKQSGIQTHCGEGEKESNQIIEAFIKHSTMGLPFIIAKFATSLDGKIATRTGDSKWITGEESRRYVHQLRGGCDAIMAGVNTVIEDDPQLTVRDDNGNPMPKQPLRVILDSQGRTPPNSRLLSEPGQTLIATSHANENVVFQLSGKGAEVLAFKSDDDSVDMLNLLETLGQRDITSVFVEGGGTVLGSLFDKGLVDKVVAFVAPVIIGGKDSPSPIAGQGVELMSEALRLKDVEMKQFGSDVAIIGYCN